MVTFTDPSRIEDRAMSTVRRSLFFSFAENYSIIGIQFVSSLIIARLLSPAEIGIFSLAVLLVGFAHYLRDFGVGQYVIQEKNLNDDRIRAAFGLTLALGWTMGGVLFLASGPVAAFYGEPGVGRVMVVLAGNFLLIPFGSITMAYLRRQLNFAPLYRVKTLSTLLHATTAVGLAYAGFGYMSMAWAAIVGTASSILMVNLIRPRHLPFWPSLKEIRHVLSFGGFASGASIVGDMGGAAPELIIGRTLDVAAVGLFGRAMGLIELFNRAVMQAVWAVALPYFSAQNFAGRDLKEGYLKAITYLTAIAWPFFAVLALLAQPAVRLLYGSRWDAAIPLVKILCLWGALGATLALTGQVLLAAGQAKNHFRLQLSATSSKVVLILMAAPFGLEAVCIMLAISVPITWAVSYSMLNKVFPIRLGELVGRLSNNLGITLCASLPAAAISLIYGLNSWMPFAFAAISAAVGWLAGILVFNHPLQQELNMLWLKLRNQT